VMLRMPNSTGPGPKVGVSVLAVLLAALARLI
jgi:hypothetical protein